MKIITHILPFQSSDLTFFITRRRKIFCNVIRMFRCRKGLIFTTLKHFQISKEMHLNQENHLFNVRNMVSSHVNGSDSWSIQLTQYFAQDLLRRTDTAWKISFAFFPCQADCWHSSELFIKWMLRLAADGSLRFAVYYFCLWWLKMQALFSPALLVFFLSWAGRR